MPSYVKICRYTDDQYARDRGCPKPSSGTYTAFTPAGYFKGHPCYGFSSKLNTRSRRKYQEIQHYVLSEKGCNDSDARVLCVRYPNTFPNDRQLVVTEHAVGECPCFVYEK
jgi:hypothetical protein